MVRKKSADEPSFTDALIPSLSFTVRGTDFYGMIRQAKAFAATVLQLTVDDVYVMSHGSMTEGDTSRFIDPQRVVLWNMQVSVGIIPESHREPKASLAVVERIEERRKTVRSPRRRKAAPKDEQP